MALKFTVKKIDYLGKRRERERLFCYQLLVLFIFLPLPLGALAFCLHPMKVPLYPKATWFESQIIFEKLEKVP